jgi:hypothetical protein
MDHAMLMPSALTRSSPSTAPAAKDTRETEMFALILMSAIWEWMTAMTMATASTCKEPIFVGAGMGTLGLDTPANHLMKNQQ